MTSRCPHRHTSYATWRLRVFTELYAVGESDCSRIGTSHRRGLRIRGLSGHRVDIKSHDSEAASHSYGAPRENNGGKPRDLRGAVENREGETGPMLTWRPQGQREREELKDIIADLESMLKEKNRPSSRENSKRPEKIWQRPFVSPVELRLRSRYQTPKQVPTRQDFDQRLASNPWASMLASPIRQCQATKARLPKDLMLTWGIMQNPENKLDYLLPVELSDIDLLQKGMRKGYEETTLLWRVEIDSIQKHPDGSRIYVTPDRAVTNAMTHAFIRRKGQSEEWMTLSSVLTNTMIPHQWRQKIDMAAAFERTERTVEPATGKLTSTNHDQKNTPDFSNLQWQPDIHVRTRNIMNERLMVALEAIAERNAMRRHYFSRVVLAMDLPDDGRLKVHGNKVLHYSEESDSKSEKDPSTSHGRKLQSSPERRLVNTVHALSPVKSDQEAQLDQESQDLSNWYPMSNTSPKTSDQEAQSGQEAQDLPNWNPMSTSSPKLNEALTSLMTRAVQESSVTGEQKQGATSIPGGIEAQDTADADPTLSKMMRASLQHVGKTPRREVWPYGSILLHVGSPAQYIATIEKWHSSNPSNLPHHPLVPPTVIVNDSFRLPIFNILTLAGPGVADRLEALTHGFTVFDYAFWANHSKEINDKAREKQSILAAEMLSQTNSRPDPATLEEELSEDISELIYKDDVDDVEAHTNREYMVFIKGSMFRAPELITEIWRLWRFIGGRNGIWAGDGAEGSKDRSSVDKDEEYDNMKDGFD